MEIIKRGINLFNQRMVNSNRGGVYIVETGIDDYKLNVIFCEINFFFKKSYHGKPFSIKKLV